jgi:F-type H+-transporting ATPase subunit beta
MSIGKIVQVIGAVVDIEFPRDEMPKVYDALVLEKDENNKLAEEGLTFEVQQQLGDGVVWVLLKVSSAVWPLRLSDTALWFRLVRRPWAESWTF